MPPGGNQRAGLVERIALDGVAGECFPLRRAALERLGRSNDSDLSVDHRHHARADGATRQSGVTIATDLCPVSFIAITYWARPAPLWRPAIDHSGIDVQRKRKPSLYPDRSGADLVSMIGMTLSAPGIHL